MVTVRLTRLNGKITRFVAKGHAGSGEYGQDIQCAAISSILQTALLGLTDYAGIDVKSKMKNGDMSVELPRLNNEQQQKAEAILETMWLGLQSVSELDPQSLKLEQEG